MSKQITNDQKIQIINFAIRIGAIGTQAGLTFDEILAISAAFTSVGIKAQAGGTAVQKVLIDLIKQGKFGKQGPSMMGPTAERGPKEAAISINRDPRLYQRFVEIGIDTESALGNIKLIRTVPLDARKLSSAGINMQTDADLLELPHIEKVDVQGVPAVNIVTKKVTNSIRKKKLMNKAGP